MLSRTLIEQVAAGRGPRAVLEGLQGDGEPPLNPRSYDNGSLGPGESAEGGHKFTRDEAWAILKSLGAEDRTDLNQFLEGLGVEWEHADLVGGDLLAVGRIVLDHLDEDPEYYTKLHGAGLETVQEGTSGKYPPRWVQQRGTPLWQQGWSDNGNDPKYAARHLLGLKGDEFAAYSMGMCDQETDRLKTGKPRRVQEGAEASDLVGLKGHIEGPYALGGSEEAAWMKAFGDYAPGRVVALFDDGATEVSKIVKQVFAGLDKLSTIKVDGQVRTFGLYQGVKFMLNPDDRTASFDVGDRGFVKKLERVKVAESLEELIDLGTMEPTAIMQQILTWAHGDKKKAAAMLDGYVTRATGSTKPKFLVARKMLQTA